MDKAKNIISVVEAGEPVIWTKPGDLPFDSRKDLPALGGMFDGEFHAAFLDISVRLIKKDFDASTFKTMLKIDNKEEIDFGKVEKK